MQTHAYLRVDISAVVQRLLETHDIEGVGTVKTVIV